MKKNIPFFIKLILILVSVSIVLGTLFLVVLFHFTDNSVSVKSQHTAIYTNDSNNWTLTFDHTLYHPQPYGSGPRSTESPLAGTFFERGSVGSGIIFENISKKNECISKFWIGYLYSEGEDLDNYINRGEASFEYVGGTNFNPMSRYKKEKIRIDGSDGWRLERMTDQNDGGERVLYLIPSDYNQQYKTQKIYAFVIPYEEKSYGVPKDICLGEQKAIEDYFMTFHRGK